ncbi:histidine kinase [Fulvivirga ulvae]|uniref:sensor histidine kinase n=1 Tax=Fulvivirga ulvae TaxID=2904245 RepID=UPI001F41395E|nr:histidine kinase [Fulvivirga ulvae]UII33782.1 histidine kinase [Fulvivirga ulvae]
MNKINYKTIGIHLLAWLTYGFIIFNLISSFRGDYNHSLWFDLRILTLHALAFYLNVYFLLPRLMEKNKYMAYSFSIILVLVFLYFVRELFAFFEPIDRFAFIRDIFERPYPAYQLEKGMFADSAVRTWPFTDSLIMSKTEPPFIGSQTRPVPGLFIKSFGDTGFTRAAIRFNPPLLMDILSSIAILFISTTYWVTKQAQKREQMEMTLKSENLDTELKLLKSQINPHFLFNALNNIYSLSYRNQKMAPDMVMKLSEMLRYVLYETNESKVTLDKEIAYINNYIDFQRLKTDNKANINIHIDIHNPELLIEPMLLIPFIENSFKHSNIDHPDGWVSINLTTFGKASVLFEVSNSKPVTEFTKDNTAGIGLENVEKRLRLLYPEKHDLTVEENRDSFTVKLIVIL